MNAGGVSILDVQFANVKNSLEDLVQIVADIIVLEN